MACFTYLPQANPSAQEGMETRYVKPCKSSCENYVKECKVECCDDSVQCVFNRRPAKAKILSQMQVTANDTTIQGYANEDGPSLTCTGSARRMAGLAGAAVAALLYWIL